MKKPISIIAFVCLCSILTVALAGCGILSGAAKLQVYDFGGDQVPTINAVIGEERKVTNVETGTENGAQQKQYTYESASVQADVAQYMNYLMDNGWIATQDFDTTVMPGSAQVGMESVDAGQILILSVAYEDTNYAVKITKVTGTLDLNE